MSCPNAGVGGIVKVTHRPVIIISRLGVAAKARTLNEQLASVGEEKRVWPETLRCKLRKSGKTQDNIRQTIFAATAKGLGKCHSKKRQFGHRGTGNGSQVA